MRVDVLNSAGSRIYSPGIDRIAFSFVLGQQVDEGNLFVARELRKVGDMTLRDDHEVIGDPAAVPHVIFEPVFDDEEMRVLDRICELVAVTKHTRIAVCVKRTRLLFAV